MAETLVIGSDLKEVRQVERRLLREVADHGYSDSACFAIRLAVEEALNNAAKHGNGLDPNKSITVSYEVDEKSVRITITDEGGGFDPHAIPDPTADENLEKPCGRGIMLMKAYMDEVEFGDGGNRVRMVKDRE